MDMKCAFLNAFLDEEVFVEQPPRFENPSFPDHVYKFDKAFYGLKQASRQCYEKLSKFLIENDFVRVKLILFFKNRGSDILVVQIYVDIILGTTNEF